MTETSAMQRLRIGAVPYVLNPTPMSTVYKSVSLYVYKP